jgi:hypothetical protein
MRYFFNKLFNYLPTYGKNRIECTGLIGIKLFNKE